MSNIRFKVMESTRSAAQSVFAHRFRSFLTTLGIIIGVASVIAVCQGIVGGALIPVIQGVAADSVGIQLSFVVPMLCYIYIGWYALKGADQS